MGESAGGARDHAAGVGMGAGDRAGQSGARARRAGGAGGRVRCSALWDASRGSPSAAPRWRRSTSWRCLCAAACPTTINTWSGSRRSWRRARARTPSLDAWRRRRAGGRGENRGDAGGAPTLPPARAPEYGVPIRIAWLLLGMVFFFPGLWKLRTAGLGWITGDTLRNQMYWKWAVIPGLTPPLRIDRFPATVARGGGGRRAARARLRVRDLAPLVSDAWPSALRFCFTRSPARSWGSTSRGSGSRTSCSSTGTPSSGGDADGAERTAGPAPGSGGGSPAWRRRSRSAWCCWRAPQRLAHGAPRPGGRSPAIQRSPKRRARRCRLS